MEGRIVNKHKGRLISMFQLFSYCVRLYFAPLTGAAHGIRREYRRIERAERMRRQAAD